MTLEEIEMEQKAMELAEIANTKIWETKDEKTERLVKKFGTETAAKEKTLLVLFKGLAGAIASLPKSNPAAK